MPHIQPRTIAATDQIMAVLRDRGVPMTTREIMDAIGGNEGTSYIYQILKREERANRVRCSKIGQRQPVVIWESLVPAEIIPDGP